MTDRQPTRRAVLAAAASAAAVASAAVLLPRAAFGQAAKPRLKVGQIGTTHAHADKLGVYRRSADYEVVGVVEPDDARWARAKDSPAYRDLPRLTEEQLFSTPGLSAVTVETHVRDLVPTGTRCLKAGFPIHLDKPAGGNLADFRALLDVATEKRLLVQLGYMLRASPATALIKRLLKDGTLGDVFEVHGVMSKVVAPAERKRLAEFPGGMLFELGCHLVDQVVDYLGKPDRVVPLSTRSKQGEADGLLDNGLAAFVYPRATATVRSTALEVDGGKRRHLTLCGMNGTLELLPLEPPGVKLTLAADGGGFKKGSQAVPMPKYERFVGDAADMAAILRGEKANEYPPAHELVVHECVLRAAGVMGQG